MTVTTSQIRAAWRRLCPDITNAEIEAMTAVGMAGSPARVALRAYRAGRSDATREAAAEVGDWLAEVEGVMT